MPDSVYRYALDPTGVNKDNSISGEIHTLSTADFRVIVPDYGPFFTESVAVYDKTTNRLLGKNTDYFCVELLQEPTLRYGKEIAQLIVIVNQDVTALAAVSYQVLGGLYQNSAKAVANLYETVMVDKRPVDFKNVMNKPQEYPPSLHMHLLKDTVGFEPVVAALERIRNAISLSDVPAWEALVEWVKVYTANSTDITKDPSYIALTERLNNIEIRTAIVTEGEIHNVTSSAKLVTFERLIQATDKLNFNTMKLSPMRGEITPGSSVVFNLETTNMDDSTVLYWTIKHDGTDVSDFGSTSGLINITDNKGSFNFSVSPTAIAEPTEKFSVEIRAATVEGVILVSTGDFLIYGAGSNGGNTAGMLLSCCLYRPALTINAKRLYLNGGFCGK